MAGLEIPPGTARRALERGEAAGMLTVLNPAPVPALSWSEVRGLIATARVLTPNRAEAAALALAAAVPADHDGAPGEPEAMGPYGEAAAAARRLLAAGAREVAITLGPWGCLAAKAGRGLFVIPAVPVEAVDTVGAGDAFTGALAVALAEGRLIAEAADWACAAAALAVTRAGAQPSLPHRREIDELAEQVAHARDRDIENTAEANEQRGA